MKVCINAGGTGGHIYPALSLANFLQKNSDSFFYIGNKDSMEETLAHKHQIQFYPIRNYGVFKNTFKMKWRTFTSSIKSVFTALKYLKQEKPDILVSFGGYVTVPVVLAAWLLRIPVILHEQNAIAGKANRLLSRFARGIALSYEPIKDDFPKKKIRIIGNPRAYDIAQLEKDYSILDQYNLSAQQPIVYIVMGSLGSYTINKIMIDMLQTYPFDCVQFIISGGTKNTSSLQVAFENHPNIKVYSQVDQVKLLPFVSVVVSRAGATSLSEIITSGIPSILIPSPYVADNHQYYNAKYFVDRSAAILLEEKDLSKESLVQVINSLLEDDHLRLSIKESTQALSYPKATEELYQWMKEIVYG